ncbi:MAG: S24 family peptidase [Candidatus Pedobacter colombiensis]|uniref:S24 family peptidase n=1 Tax=Candidatus Pedobacter colombiensis TaxID=3121371 RepID=A0AAJ5WA96_9SPHI|nr:XRE family transcriptional regulator [Pedobacter sp.]WEK19769.1 MAG: S24 family peptidase [Pedobacter sp.]
MKELDPQSIKIGLRLKELRELTGKGPKEYYSPLNRNVSNYVAIEHGKRSIGPRLIKEVSDYYHINPEWIRTGKGEVFVETQAAEVGLVVEPEEKGVPFFNVNLSEISFGTYGVLGEAPEYYVNFRPFNDCDAYLPIYGDSMYPKYASGEIIAIREITNFNVLQWGEAYLVVADERANHMTTVKLIFEHPDQKKIILRSSNPNFKGDTVIDRASIQKMFLIKGKVTRNQL